MCYSAKLGARALESSLESGQMHYHTKAEPITADFKEIVTNPRTVTYQPGTRSLIT